MNSSGTSFSQSIKKSELLRKINNEFAFFGLDYFNKKRENAFINLFLGGHGARLKKDDKKGYIPLIDAGSLYYEDIFNHALKSAEKQTK